MASIRILTADRILAFHEAASRFLAELGQARPDLGLRDPGLLEAAVSAQFMGSVGEVASADPREKTAMLVVALMEERPFFEAGAPTALLAMLVHLDENGFSPNKVAFDDYYRVFWALAEAKPGELPARKAGAEDPAPARLYRWLQENTRRTEPGVWPLGLPHLRRLLEARGFSLDEVEGGPAGSLEVGRIEETQEKRLFGLAGSRTVARLQPLHRLARPEEGALLPARIVRDVARICHVPEADLADAAARLDSLLRQHATLVQRLAKL